MCPENPKARAKENAEAQAARLFRTASARNAVSSRSHRKCGPTSRSGLRKIQSSRCASQSKDLGKPPQPSNSRYPATQRNPRSLSVNSPTAAHCLVLPPLRNYQEDLLLDRVRTGVILSAPQIGKTAAVACWLLALAWSGPGRLYWWTAPTYQQDLPGMYAIEKLASSAGILESTTKARGSMRVQLTNGSMIDFRSWDNPDNLSGPTVWGLVADEAHLLNPTASRAIRERLSSTGGPIRLIGNSGDIDGEFKRLCDIAADPMSKDYSFTRWTWRDKLAALDAGERAFYAHIIDDEQIALPSWQFKAVYEAEWTTSLSAVFLGVQEANKLHTLKRPRNKDEQYVIGWDIAEAHDYTVGMPVQLISPAKVQAMIRFRRIDYTQLEDRIARASKHWNNALSIIEINGPGRPVFQALRRRGVRVYPWTTTSASKNDMVLATAGDIEYQRLLMADMPPLQAELSAYRSKRTAGGAYAYSAPSGRHDDCVMSLCIGNWGRRLMMAQKNIPSRIRIAS